MKANATVYGQIGTTPVFMEVYTVDSFHREVFPNERFYELAKRFPNSTIGQIKLRCLDDNIQHFNFVAFIQKNGEKTTDGRLPLKFTMFQLPDWEISEDTAFSKPFAAMNIYYSTFSDGGTSNYSMTSTAPFSFPSVSGLLRLQGNDSGAVFIAREHCPGSGYPGRVNVAIKPDSKRAAEDWFSLNNLSWEWNGWASINGGYGQSFGNVAALDAPFGSEQKLIDALEAQPWTFSAFRIPIEQGPDESIVLLPANTVVKDVGDQQFVRRELLDLLRKRWSNLNLTDGDVLAYHKGLGFKVHLNVPMSKLSYVGFGGYWVKLDLVFQFTRQVAKDNSIGDEVWISIPDGWLAKWPDQISPPPAGHYDHLDPGGDGQFKDFQSLTMIQYDIANFIAANWNGQLE